MEIQLKGIGWLLLALALLHAGFPQRFGWKRDLMPLTLLNRQLVYVHTFFIALVLLLLGLLCLCEGAALAHTPLGHTVSLGLAIFWGTRLLFQVAVYSPKLWRGKRFETVVHILFVLLWSYLTTVFLLVYTGLPT